MNDLENCMIEILNDLKKNYYAVGVKAEFGTECTNLKEAILLKKIANESNLELTIKVGGCEALKEICEAKSIGADNIVAPMIESPYAAKKYIQNSKIAISEKERKSMKFLINIETKYGIQYLEEILNADFSEDIDGIVFGRTDMTASMGMPNDDADSTIIYDIAEKIAILAKKYNKELIIGGTVSPASIPFFKKLPQNSLYGYETRKVVFNAESLKHDTAETGIIKAFEFEKLWIKNKQNYSMNITPEDNKRIELLENRAKLPV